MRVLLHRKHAHGYLLQVHVDESRLCQDEDGTAYPDPDSVREFSWSHVQPKLDAHGKPVLKDGEPVPVMSEKKWIEMQLREAKLLIEAEVDDPPERALPSEGQTL